MAHWFLLSGILLGLTGIPIPSALVKKWSTRLLQFSVICLGAKMKIGEVLLHGSQGLLLTFVSLCLIFFIGFILNRILKLNHELYLLITSGTAICGGSAIAAVAPVIQASSSHTAIFLGIVFLLNAVALFIFPSIGHHLHLNDVQFGTWAALAIHDTSSVVGAGTAYSPEALALGTTTKLARALWILPLSFAVSILQKRTTKWDWKNTPWFIFLFLLTAGAFSYISFLKPYSKIVSDIANYGFSATLFLIGLNINKSQIKSIGLSAFVYGVALWFIVSTTSLIYVLQYKSGG